MLIKGIRILDTTNHVVNVELNDILIEIPNGNLYHWSILSLEGIGSPDKKPIPTFQKEILNSSNGFFISWDKLNVLASKFSQIIDMVLIGSKDKHNLKRYATDQEMYEVCDIVVDMFDSSFWEIFSKDEAFINRLALKFKKTEFIMSDFQKEYEPE